MKGHEESFGAMDIFIVLIMVMVSEEYTLLKLINLYTLNIAHYCVGIIHKTTTAAVAAKRIRLRVLL